MRKERWALSRRKLVFIDEECRMQTLLFNMAAISYMRIFKFNMKNSVTTSQTLNYI